MDSDGLSEATAELEAALRKFRQGDVVDLGGFVHLADRSRPGTEAARTSNASGQSGIGPVPSTALAGLVIVSQTCDIQAKNPLEAPFVLCARVVELPPGIAEEARKHRRPRYAWLPRLGDTWVADLDQIQTVEKSALVGLAPNRGLGDTAEQAAFGFAAGRRLSRFAFPDDVHDVLEPLQRILTSKHGKEASPVGAVAREVEQIRAEALPDWESGSYDIQLYIVLPANHIPRPEDLDGQEVSPALEAWLSTPRPHAEIAERLGGAAALPPADTVRLWNELADAWARLCVPIGDVLSVSATAVCADEMTVDEYQSSQMLDLDFLSAAG